MKYSLLIFFIAISLNIFSQQDSLEVELKKISIGISLSANYSYRIQIEDGVTAYNDVMYLGKDHEVGQFGQTMNFDLRVFLNNNHRLNIGLQVSNEGYKTSDVELMFGDVIDPRRGFVYPTTGVTGLSYNYKFNYGGVNIGLKSNYGNKSVRLIHSIGLVPKFLISGSAIGRLTIGNQTANVVDFRTTEDFNRFNLEAYISIGGEWEFKENRIVEFSPIFRFNSLKTSDYALTSYLWNLGFRIGLFI